MDLYQLREFARLVQIVYRTGSGLNLETGAYDNHYDALPVKAIPLPVSLQTIAGERRAPVVYDRQRRSFLISYCELGDPRFIVLPRMWVTDKDKRYEIESVEDTEHGLIVTGRQETEVPFVSVDHLIIESTLYFGHTTDEAPFSISSPKLTTDVEFEEEIDES